jgi:O-methyltransferase
MINYAEITAADQELLNRCQGAAYSTMQGVQHTFLLAQSVIKRNVSGIFVECGVANGACAAAMAFALTKHGQPRSFYLFDSFQGIPLAGPHDDAQPGIGPFVADVNLPVEQRLRSSGISVAGLDLVRQNMANWGLASVDFHYVKGWFQHTMPHTILPPIAMLRLDGDLYESTACCLKYLYPQVVPGGCILLDDYPLVGSRKAALEYLESVGQTPDIRVEVDTGAGYWWK